MDEVLQQLARLGFAGIDAQCLRTAVLDVITRSADLACMQHPLGFYHILLHKEDAVTIRLHYWPARNRPPSSAVTPYHDHVWSLQSCVLTGTLRNVLLSVKPDHLGSYELAAIKQVRGVDAVVPTSQRVSIAISEASPQSRGNVYSIEPGIFHCTEVPDGIATITIVRAQVLLADGPRTLVPVGYSGQAPARVYLAEKLAATVKREIQDLLSS